MAAAAARPERPHTLDQFNQMFGPPANPQAGHTRRPSDTGLSLPPLRAISEDRHIEPLSIKTPEEIAQEAIAREYLKDVEAEMQAEEEAKDTAFVRNLFKEDEPTYWDKALGILGGMTRKTQPKLLSTAFGDLPKADLKTHQECVDRVEEATALRDAWLKMIYHSFSSLKTDEEKDLHKAELVKAFKKAVDVRNEGLKAMLHFRLLDMDKEPANMDKIQEKHVKACEQAFKLDDYERKLFLKLKSFYKNSLKPADVDAGLKPKEDSSANSEKYPYTKTFAKYAVIHFIVTGKLPWTALLPTSWSQAGLVAASLAAVAYEGYNNPKLPDKDDLIEAVKELTDSALTTSGLLAAVLLIPSSAANQDKDRSDTSIEKLIDAGLALKLLSLFIDTKNKLSQPFKDKLKLAATATVNFTREYLKDWRFALLTGPGLSASVVVANWGVNWYWNHDGTIANSSKAMFVALGCFGHLFASGALRLSDED